MPRKKLIRHEMFPYHITARCNNQEWFRLPLRDVYSIFSMVLNRVSDNYHARIFAFVLMSNHFHAVLSTPMCNLDKIMHVLMSKTSRMVGRRTGTINHLYGSRYDWSLLSDAFAVGCAYKYVARNPVRAGLATRVENYPYSSFARESLAFIPVLDGTGYLWRWIPNEANSRLDWLNIPSTKEREEMIKNGLRKSEFQLSKQTSLQKTVVAISKEIQGPLL